ncbi:MAG TPA: ABC transporter ATP-binding protein [Candidatus Caldiarchaeum subterraneum]|uniref:ABC transporter ATP-binding protein n=1 Tax=Caldiarchaeum subterraneum TaxID=311458 RepID=A0A833EAC0_CALS0|nr:ABC transporter ATP-binding protein [Candidatus Caldarchaeum subterraneum]
MVVEETVGRLRITESILEGRELHVRFNLRRGLVISVFEGLSIQVRYAEFLGIAGPVGCGKTTLLKVLAGLLKPERGEVYYKNQRLEKPTPAISLVLPTTTLFPWYTVLENVMLALYSDKSLTREDKIERCRAFLDMVGLSAFDSAYPSELSDGMKKKVILARALVTHPDVLLLDEPFDNIDPLAAVALRSEIENMWMNESMSPSSVVLVSHDIEELVELCDRVVVLTERPARVKEVVEINLQRPRDKRRREFYDYVDKIFTLLS